MKVTVLGVFGDVASFMPVVYPHGTVSVSSLSSFSYAGSSYKPACLSITLSLVVHLIQDYFKKERGRKRKYITPQEEKSRREQKMKKMRVTIRANLVIGYWGLVPMK